MSIEAIASSRFLKVTPRKTRSVADLVRGRKCSEALDLLRFLPKATRVPVEKTLRSAIANAVNHAEKGRLNPDDLKIEEVYVDSGVTMKRYRPRARGRADVRRKRTAHIVVRVTEDHEKESLSRGKG